MEVRPSYPIAQPYPYPHGNALSILDRHPHGDALSHCDHYPHGNTLSHRNRDTDGDTRADGGFGLPAFCRQAAIGGISNVLAYRRGHPAAQFISDGHPHFYPFAHSQRCSRDREPHGNSLVDIHTDARVLAHADRDPDRDPDSLLDGNCYAYLRAADNRCISYAQPNAGLRGVDRERGL